MRCVLCQAHGTDESKLPVFDVKDRQLIETYYGRYTLGRHVVLVRKADLAIGDIIKDVAVK